MTIILLLTLTFRRLVLSCTHLLPCCSCWERVSSVARLRYCDVAACKWGGVCVHARARGSLSEEAGAAVVKVSRICSLNKRDQEIGACRQAGLRDCDSVSGERREE